jgi:ubiquinone biosynthesis protein UbiJ
MSGSLDELLDELTSQEGRIRELAAAYLGDWLIAAARTEINIDPVVTALVEALLAENDADVQEEIAHSLGHLVESGNIPVEIVRPLAQHLRQLDTNAAEHVTALLEALTWQHP